MKMAQLGADEIAAQNSSSPGLGAVDRNEIRNAGEGDPGERGPVGPREGKG